MKMKLKQLILSYFNPIALRMAKTPLSFGCSECKRLKATEVLLNHTQNEILKYRYSSILSIDKKLTHQQILSNELRVIHILMKSD